MKKSEDPKFLWLKHVRQEGLVISRAAVEDFEPIGQKAEDTEAFKDAKHDIWQVATDVLEWPEAFIKKGDDLPEAASFPLPDIGTILKADGAVVSKDGEPLLLIKELAEGIDPDERGLVPDWENVTHQQAFDRHLRDSGVEAGLLVMPSHYRLTYSPKGETPGYLEWPIDGMTETAGRPMLGGFKLILNKIALWGPDQRRLSTILKESREKQNTVSTKLAGQVLGALYTLLRGFTEAADSDTKEKMEWIADHNPHHFYEGLLTVLLRLVFVLFAEDRDLLPSSDNQKARSLYDNGYSIRELFGELEQDAALYPDTMTERYGAWGRLAGLFKLIHNGTGSDFMHERRGKLFDPKAFPFLTGQFEDTEPSKILPISDDCIHKVLRSLLILDGERLSYKTLDVEQIGSVYETVMGFTIERTRGRSIALRSGKANVPAYVNLDRLVELSGDKRKKYLKDTIDYEVTAAQNKLLKPAKTWQDIVTALDNKIDERGSPDKKTCIAGTIILQPTDERRKTGSHYTPRSLTAPIVEEALEPILMRLGDEATPDEVLNLKICDPAMGSGAFLVEACRALGERLQTAWERHKHLMPDEAKEDPVIFARREVAKRCIYGVDKNHMATDLAKLSMWLITLSRNEDFTFLDHALKTGDSLVGLSLDEISNVTWELKDDLKRPLFASAFARRVQDARDKRRLIRTAADNVTYEIQNHRVKQADEALDAVRLGGDAVIAAFFAGNKAKERKEILNKLQDQIALGSESGWAAAREMVAKLGTGEHPIKPYHWEIEFPEVFDGENPGFDCFVGNPPFAGKNTITRSNRDGFLDWLKVISPGAHGNADLVAHFFRRTYSHIKEGGTMGLISTNTIGQGDTRESGLRFILQEGNGGIYRAQRRIKWPGDAAVVVSTLHVKKGKVRNFLPQLDGRSVNRISAFVREGDLDETPEVLTRNKNIAFQGSIILGMGFTFDDENAIKGLATPIKRMNELLINEYNRKVIKPYLGGDEVNNLPDQRHQRYVIDFQDYPLKRMTNYKNWTDSSSEERSKYLLDGFVPPDYPFPVASDWPELLDIVERLVKPSRLQQKMKKRRKYWWRHDDNRNSKIDWRRFDRIYVTGRVKQYHIIAPIDKEVFFANTLFFFLINENWKIGNLYSAVYEIWIRVLNSTLEDRLNFSIEDGFENFPFITQGDSKIVKSLDTLNSFRQKILIETNSGLTKTYNRFHSPYDIEDDIVELRRLHTELDDAVLRAYGWDDLADMCAPGGEAEPRFLHDTDEPEYAYQKRYHWPAWFRDKVLARLLELNKERAETEKETAKNSKSDKLKSGALQLDQKGTLL